MLSLTDKLFNDIDKEIEKAIKNEKCEKDLWKIYRDFWVGLKEKTGTSAGFTGLAEYIFLKALILLLKNKYNINFTLEVYTYKEKAKKTPETYCFQSKEKNIVITHDLYIDIKYPHLKIQEGYKARTEKKPDIVIFKDKKPIAVFEIKIYCSSWAELEKDIKKMRSIGEETNKKLHRFSILENGPKQEKDWIDSNNVLFIVSDRGEIPIEKIKTFKEAVRLISEELMQ